jgi:hypothetical protein
VEKALALDGSLAEAHVALAAIQFEHEWDLPAAEKSIQRGLEPNPSYAMGHQWYAEYLAAGRRREEALLGRARKRPWDADKPISFSDMTGGAGPCNGHFPTLPSRRATACRG